MQLVRFVLGFLLVVLRPALRASRGTERRFQVGELLLFFGWRDSICDGRPSARLPAGEQEEHHEHNAPTHGKPWEVEELPAYSDPDSHADDEP